MTAAETRTALTRLRDLLSSAPAFEAAAMEAAGRTLADELGWKPGELFTPLRVAITCRRVSTPLFETMEVLGREECLARMDAAMEAAKGLA
jgi:glutamyl-tRNA synthetase